MKNFKHQLIKNDSFIAISQSNDKLQEELHEKLDKKEKKFCDMHRSSDEGRKRGRKERERVNEREWRRQRTTKH